MDIKVRQLTGVFGGEVQGAGSTRPPGADEVAAIAEAA